MALLVDRDIAEVIVNEETFNENMTRLSNTLQAAARADTSHLSWTQDLRPGEKIGEHLKRRIQEFVDNLEPSEKPGVREPNIK